MFDSSWKHTIAMLHAAALLCKPNFSLRSHYTSEFSFFDKATWTDAAFFWVNLHHYTIAGCDIIPGGRGCYFGSPWTFSVHCPKLNFRHWGQRRRWKWQNPHFGAETSTKASDKRLGHLLFSFRIETWDRIFCWAPDSDFQWVRFFCGKWYYPCAILGHVQ